MDGANTQVIGYSDSTVTGAPAHRIWIPYGAAGNTIYMTALASLQTTPTSGTPIYGAGAVAKTTLP